MNNLTESKKLTHIALTTIRGAIDVSDREERKELRRILLKLADEIRRKLEKEK